MGTDLFGGRTFLCSYSLYLWHWPVFALSHYWSLEVPSLKHRVVLVLASFCLAVISWRFVEKPIRNKTVCGRRSSLTSWAGGLAAILTAWAVLLILLKGIPSRFSKEFLAYDDAKREGTAQRRLIAKVSLEDARGGHFPRLGKADARHPSLMVWGDSHAERVLPAVHVLGGQAGIGVVAAWYPGTPPVIGYCPPWNFSLGKESSDFNQATLDFIATERIPGVLLVARWSQYFADDAGGSSNRGEFGRQLLKMVRGLREVGAKPFILAEVPKHLIDVPRALRIQRARGSEIRRYVCDRHDLSVQNQAMNSIYRDLEAAGAIIVDASGLLLEDQGASFKIEVDGKPLYTDDNHLTRSGASTISRAFEPVVLFSKEESEARFSEAPGSK